MAYREKDQSRRTGIQEVLDAFIAPDAYENRYQRQQRLKEPDLIAGPAAPGMQWSSLQQPYPTAARQVPTARIPQARPDYTVVSSKSDVANLQRQLNSRGAHLKVDGIVGPLTMGAAREFGSVPDATRLQWSGLQSPYPAQQTAQQVPTARIPQARPAVPSDRIAGVFDVANSPLVRQLGNPYTNSTGGANAIQTARIPQARPPTPQWALPVQQAAAAPLAYQLQQAQMLRNAAAAAQREAQARSSQGSSRSGMGGGGGYTGGSYGGYGGGSIASGVGGAFRSR